MATYAGGTQVQSGYYLDAKSFAFAGVAKDGGALPGGAQARWVRIPLLAVVAAAPAMGGLFVIALPFIGFGVTAYAIAKKLGLGARSGAREIAATMAAGMVPGEASLTGRPGDGAAAGPAGPAGPADPKTEALEKEIEAKRAS